MRSWKLCHACKEAYNLDGLDYGLVKHAFHVYSGWITVVDYALQIRTRLLAPGGEALGGVVGCCLHMIRNEGFLSLYKGLTPALMSMGPSCAVFYAIYDILKTSHLSHINKNGSCSEMDEERELSVVRTLLYGAIAGACAETATYPLEVIRRQLQLHQAKRVGLVTVFVKLVQREGVGSLFAGLAPSTLQVCSISTLPSFLFFIDASTVISASCITSLQGLIQHNSLYHNIRYNWAKLKNSWIQVSCSSHRVIQCTDWSWWIAGLTMHPCQIVLQFVIQWVVFFYHSSIIAIIIISCLYYY